MSQKEITIPIEESEKQRKRELTARLIIDLVSGFITFAALAVFYGY